MKDGMMGKVRRKGGERDSTTVTKVSIWRMAKNKRMMYIIS